MELEKNRCKYLYCLKTDLSRKLFDADIAMLCVLAAALLIFLSGYKIKLPFTCLDNAILVIGFSALIPHLLLSFLNRHRHNSTNLFLFYFQ